MVEEFFTSPLVWTMFALGLLGSLTACDNWMSRFFFAWTMVITYFFFWGILTLTGAIILCAFGLSSATAWSISGGVVADGLLGLYSVQLHCMRGHVTGISGGGPGRGGSGNSFRRSFSSPTGSA